MTNVELEAHVEMMGPLRADRLLDGAQVAAYPLYLRHDARHAQDWWRRLVADAQQTVSAVKAATQRGALFSLNGIGMGFAELRAKLGERMGRGLVA